MTVGKDFPNEQRRVRELLQVYRSIPEGTFGAWILEDILRRADEAAISGDPVAILKSYQEMKDCE
jgi:hypothetical protein